jgi:hypothetical protein
MKNFNNLSTQFVVHNGLPFDLSVHFHGIEYDHPRKPLNLVADCSTDRKTHHGLTASLVSHKNLSSLDSPMNMLGTPLSLEYTGPLVQYPRKYTL